MLLAIVVTFGVQILLGWLQYRFGKKGYSTGIGIMIPVVYVIVRLGTMVYLGSLSVPGIIGSIAIGYLYYYLYTKGKVSSAPSS